MDSPSYVSPISCSPQVSHVSPKLIPWIAMSYMHRQVCQFQICIPLWSESACLHCTCKVHDVSIIIVPCRVVIMQTRQLPAAMSLPLMAGVRSRGGVLRKYCLLSNMTKYSPRRKSIYVCMVTTLGLQYASCYGHGIYQHSQECLHGFSVVLAAERWY